MLQQDCVGNLTSKIEGDDSSYIMDEFESFMVRKLGQNETAPFMASDNPVTHHCQHTRSLTHSLTQLCRL